MSISSISGNGAFYTRPINRRESVTSADNQTASSKRRSTSLERSEQRPQGSSTLANGRQLQNNKPAEEAFQSYAETFNVDANNKAMNAYLNIGNYERQVALKQVFGIDIFA